MLKTEFEFAIDPGTIWNGVAFQQPDQPIETWVHRFYDFSPLTCVETLDISLRYTVVGQKMIAALDSLGQSGNEIKIARVYIEQPDRKITKKNRLNGTLDEHHSLVRHSARLWRRWFEMHSGYVLVDYVDSLKWQRSELLGGITRRGSYCSESFEQLALIRSRLIAGDPKIHSSHIADAVCILNHGQRLRTA